jgi:hypothetical protein
VSGDDRRGREGDYRAARVGSAVTLTAVLALMLLVDAISSEYEPSHVTLALIAGTILTLLGIEAGSWIRGR